MAAMPETIINVVTVEGAKLSLSQGDVLAIMVPQLLCAEQRQQMTHALKAAIPDGVKVIILDGAAKVAVIAKRDSTGGIVGERDDAIDFPFKGKCGKFSEIGKP